MRNAILALALTVFSFTAIQAGDAPKAQAAAKGEAVCTTGECKTVNVARKATWRERRDLVVVEPVKVVEVKKVEVKAAPCGDCCGSCNQAGGRRRLLGNRHRGQAVVVSSTAACANCK